MTHLEVAQMVEAMVALGLDPQSIGYFVRAAIGG